MTETSEWCLIYSSAHCRMEGVNRVSQLVDMTLQTIYNPNLNMCEAWLVLLWAEDNTVLREKRLPCWVLVVLGSLLHNDWTQAQHLQVLVGPVWQALIHNLSQRRHKRVEKEVNQWPLEGALCEVQHKPDVQNILLSYVKTLYNHLLAYMEE